MSNALHDLFASYEAKVTTASKTLAKSRKSVKAQRNAVTKSVPESKQHTCWLFGEDKEGNALTGHIATCIECAANTHLDVEVEGWAPPAPFDLWLKRNYKDLEFKTPNAALESDRGDIVVAYERYVDSMFNQPFTRSVFDRIVRREYSKQLAGLGDLGLLGYSADDIVDLAVFYAWAERIKRYAKATGADEAEAAHISQTLRDFRSDSELEQVAALEEDGRYVYGSDDRLRKQNNSLAVRHARERLALRAELLTDEWLAQFNDWVPTAGEVYRQVKHAYREGMREWRSSVEGLTRDGVLPESISLQAIAVGDTVKSAENEYFEVHEVDHIVLAREAMIEELKSRSDLLPAEATAAAVAEALTRGYSLYEIRREFPTDRAFSSAVRDAKVLFAA